jgi:hypothetical protein
MMKQADEVAIDVRGGDLSEDLGILGNVGICDSGAEGAKRPPPARPQASRGEGAGGGDSSRQGGPGVTLPEIFQNYTWPQMRYSAFWIHKFQKITA